MSKVINISDKLNLSRPKIVIQDKEYEVNDSVGVVFQFEELASQGTSDGIFKAISLTLGEKVLEELNIKEMSLHNLKVIVIAIMAAIQDVDYDEAERRFQQQGTKE